MKKEYSKPLLNTKAYAQFENVFAACSKNPGEKADSGMPCGWAADEPLSPNCHHKVFQIS